MVVQPADFSFVARAGQQLYSGMEDARKRKIEDEDRARAVAAYEKQLADLKADKATIMSAYEGDLMPKAKQKYMEATGETDDLKATAFVTKYFLPPLKTETPAEFMARVDASEKKAGTALHELKVKGIRDKASQEQVVSPATPGTPVGLQNAPTTTPTMTPTGTTPEDARTARLAGTMAPTSEIMNTQPNWRMPQAQQLRPEDEPVSLTDTDATPEARRSLTSAELMSLAQEKGIAGDEAIKNLISTRTNQELAGRQFPEGTTQEQVYVEQMRQGAVTPEGETYAKMFPKKTDIAREKRLSEALELKSKHDAENRRLQQRLAGLKERKLGSDERREIIRDKAKNQTDLFNMRIRIKALESGLTKANKDFGELDQASVENDMKELGELREAVELATENQTAYIMLLDEKGGRDFYTPPTKQPDAPAEKKGDPLGIR